MFYAILLLRFFYSVSVRVTQKSWSTLTLNPVPHFSILSQFVNQCSSATSLPTMVIF